MAKVEPGMFSIAWLTEAKVCSGWKAPVCAPHSFAETMLEVESRHTVDYELPSNAT